MILTGTTQDFNNLTWDVNLNPSSFWLFMKDIESASLNLQTAIYNGNVNLTADFYQELEDLSEAKYNAINIDWSIDTTRLSDTDMTWKNPWLYMNHQKLWFWDWDEWKAFIWNSWDFFFKWDDDNYLLWDWVQLTIRWHLDWVTGSFSWDIDAATFKGTLLYDAVDTPTPVEQWLTWCEITKDNSWIPVPWQKVLHWYFWWLSSKQQISTNLMQAAYNIDITNWAWVDLFEAINIPTWFKPRMIVFHWSFTNWTTKWFTSWTAWVVWNVTTCSWYQSIWWTIDVWTSILQLWGNDETTSWANVNVTLTNWAENKIQLQSKIWPWFTFKWIAMIFG